MNVTLMHPTQDFDLRQTLSAESSHVIKDLELDAIFQMMAQEDEVVLEVVKRGTLCILTDVEEILYRQDVLGDVINNALTIRKMYDLVGQTLETYRRQSFWGMSLRYPSSILHESVALLTMMMSNLRVLRQIGDSDRKNFQSKGFLAFFNQLDTDLPDEYFEQVDRYLETLGDRDGVWFSAQLGWGLKATNFVLHQPPVHSSHWLGRLWPTRPPGLHFQVAERDEAGAVGLSAIQDHVINSMANVMAQSADHVLGFFRQLHGELAFYVGCLNLVEVLNERGIPICKPSPASLDSLQLSFQDLFPLTLVTSRGEKTVGNNLEADSKELVVITGANQGGKSTFLRSIGIAQLFMQCGMVVSARAFRANVVRGIFTHFKREEDTELQHGKLDEELERLSQIVAHLTPRGMILFNESYSSTNEQEGSAIAEDVVTALVECGVKVLYVTHLHLFAASFYRSGKPAWHFIRASRLSDGTRPFKMEEGKPLATSFGRDLYRRVFDG